MIWVVVAILICAICGVYGFYAQHKRIAISEKRMDAKEQEINELIVAVQETLISIPKIVSDTTNKRLDDELSRLEKLKTDVIKLLRLMIDKNLITQKEANEAIK